MVRSKNNGSRPPRFKIQIPLLSLNSFETWGKWGSSGLHFLLSNGHDTISSGSVQEQDLVHSKFPTDVTPTAATTTTAMMMITKGSCRLLFWKCWERTERLLAGVHTSFNFHLLKPSLHSVSHLIKWHYPSGSSSVPKLKSLISKFLSSNFKISFKIYLNTSFLEIFMATNPVQATAIFSLGSCNNKWLMVLHSSFISSN